MKKLLILFSCTAMLFLTTGIAWAAVIDFEDLDDGYSFDMTKPAYEGFIWWNYTVVEVPEGYESLVHSGDQGLVGGGAIPFMFYANTSLATAGLFDFNGVWLSTPDEDFDSIIVSGLDEGSNTLFSTTIDAPSNPPEISWIVITGKEIPVSSK